MEEAPKSGLSRGLKDIKQPLAPEQRREMSFSSVGGSVRLGSFYCAGCQVIFCLLTCVSGLTTSLWQCWEWLRSQPSPGTGNVSSCCSSSRRCGQQRAHSHPFAWTGVLGKPLWFEVQEIAPSRNSKSGSPALSFFHFLLQEQPYPESSELQKEMLPIIPEAGSNYQPWTERLEDAEVLSSYRHMGMNLESAANFNGMVHMPEVQLVCSFLPEDWS